MVELSAELVGAVLAVAAVAGPSLYFLGRLRSDLDHARRDIERLTEAVTSLQEGRRAGEARIAMLLAATARDMLPADESQQVPP
ncbi:MAG TPA: hypothetical protein VI997_02705 [Candidatus Thermoplasmatota archaeon]|nr:hypothetical protein [Candidatus Thermoplasmatota archaeon]